MSELYIDVAARCMCCAHVVSRHAGARPYIYGPRKSTRRNVMQCHAQLLSCIVQCPPACKIKMFAADSHTRLLSLQSLANLCDDIPDARLLHFVLSLGDRVTYLQDVSSSFTKVGAKTQ